MSRLFSFSLAASAVLTIATSAIADGHSSEALMKATDARHAQMQMIGYHTGILGSMAKGTTPYDADIAKAAADNLAAAASMNRITLWLEGSEQGTIEGSRAKAEIWSDPEGFEGKAIALETTSLSMALAAGTGLEALQGAMGGVGESCGACHKAYRGPKN